MPDDQIRFLIVDDIQENMIALEALLRRDGLRIDFAGSATEALEMMLVNDYALAFLDVQMPEIDGYELAELMRGAERTRGVPIIFVTAADRDERRRFRGYEAGAVDYIFKPLDPLILRSKAEVFFRIGRQARELERQRDEMRVLAHHRDVAISRLKAHADNSPLALVECDRDLTIRSWSQGAERMFGVSAEQMLGQTIGQHRWLASDACTVLQGWIDNGTSAPRHSTEMTATRNDGESIHCEVFGSILRDPTDGNLSLSLQMLDVTERRRAEEVRSLLIGELNHRIKNTLANVQAIARQTLRQADNIDDFEQVFIGRLLALSRAHSILSDVTWTSAPLDHLIDEQIRAGTLDAMRLVRKGPKVQLSPENTLRLALSLHELGTNAAKYGALSVPGGVVDLSWKTVGQSLVLKWEERGGPTVSPPARTGFGMTLIHASAGGEEDTVQADWRETGVIWTITLPVGVETLKTKTAAKPVENIRGPMKRSELGGSRVLVVEDEPLVALDISHELKAAGALSVNIARTIGQALQAIEHSDIDVALLDGNLSGERVDEVAFALSRRAIPFCFVSGYGRQHLPQDFQDAPIIEKPFRADALLPVLNELIRS
ncbi:response regulator [Paracoccus aestuariivivens]|uniref:histidine kinase n=1 Tax=Paracoccus aestuariivivens TaxID=1820333 RepID=A0A6L6J8Z8_9RHOB|nr:response regulator [Paracoccus aestuariivivens]MTH77127.1 response regulator [Paracoccus aestuariivivens]